MRTDTSKLLPIELAKFQGYAELPGHKFEECLSLQNQHTFIDLRIWADVDRRFLVVQGKVRLWEILIPFEQVKTLYTYGTLMAYEARPADNYPWLLEEAPVESVAKTPVEKDPDAPGAQPHKGRPKRRK